MPDDAGATRLIRGVPVRLPTVVCSPLSNASSLLGHHGRVDANELLAASALCSLMMSATPGA